MLGEKLELNDIPFLFQEHTTVSKVIEPSDVLPVSQVVEPGVGSTASAHSWVVWASWRDCCLYGIPLLEFVCVSLLVV